MLAPHKSIDLPAKEIFTKCKNILCDGGTFYICQNWVYSTVESLRLAPIWGYDLSLILELCEYIFTSGSLIFLDKSANNNDFVLTRATNLSQGNNMQTGEYLVKCFVP